MERSDPKKCCILVPSRDGIELLCESGLHVLSSRGYTVRVTRGVTSIDQIRCQMATDALGDGFSELFWIDDDIGFEPDDVERLRSSNRLIIGGVYVKKGEPALAVRWKEGTMAAVLGKGGGVVEVKYAATGFLYTHANVYSTLVARGIVGPSAIGQFGRPMMPYFQPTIVTDANNERHYLAEDWAFFHRAAAAGIPTYVDTTIRLTHVGRYAYSWEDLLPRQRASSITVEIAE